MKNAAGPIDSVVEYILKQSGNNSHQTCMADVEPPSATQPFCAWSQDARNFALHVPAEVIGNLGAGSLVAFKRVPRRGLETGGILLGRTDFQGDTTSFWIEGFAPVESEHRFGPSYLLSDSDLAHFQTELARIGTVSLGIYRSQTRSEHLAIQDADTGLLEKCFGISDSLFLMLAPLTRMGAFYFRDNGNLKCVHQFTWVSSLSSVATQSRTFSPQLNLPAPPAAGTQGAHANIARHSADQGGALVVASQESDREGTPEATTNQDSGKMPSRTFDARRFFAMYSLGMTAIHRWAIDSWSKGIRLGSGVRFRSWVLAAVTLGVLTLSLLAYSLHRSAAPDQRSPNFLYLTVERAGTALRLQWDGKSSAVRGATRAVLHIQDGDQQSDRELARSELQAGQFTYQPQHSAVTFRLNVYAGEPNAIGLVQVMLPPSPIAAAPLTQPIAQAAHSRESELIAEEPSTEPLPEPARNSWPITPLPLKPIARTEVPAPQSAFPIKSNAKRDPNTETQLPAVRSSEASNSSPPAARGTPLSNGLEESGWHSLNTARNAISVPGRELTVRALTTPVPGSRWGSLFGKIPLVGRLRKQAKPVEAAPVYQPRPIVRMPGDQQLIGPVAVGVKVYVSESGVVDDAEIVDFGDYPPNLTLANAALAAARNWTFAPPQVDDIPVASQMIIRFYFSP